MGCNEARAWIRFPAQHLQDKEIRGILEKTYDVEFPDDVLKSEEDDRDIFVANGIFSFSGEVCYGELTELEPVLVAKGIPFDRESFPDYGVDPARRIFRPGDPDFDRTFPLDANNDDMVVGVREIREILDNPGKVRAGNPALNRRGGFGYSPGVSREIALRRFLDEKFPPYPPLEDFVPEIQKARAKIALAVNTLMDVDFSRSEFDGLAAKIPWASLQEAAGIVKNAKS